MTFNDSEWRNDDASRGPSNVSLTSNGCAWHFSRALSMPPRSGGGVPTWRFHAHAVRDSHHGDRRLCRRPVRRRLHAVASGTSAARHTTVMTGRNPLDLARVVLAALVVVVVAPAVSVDSQQRGAAFSASELAALPKANWLKNGGNLFNQNYSPLAQINRETVGSVKGVWRTHLNGSGMAAKYSGEAQPVVHEGTIYVVTGADDVFALSVKTGAILWTHKASLPDNITTVCCGWTSRGVAIGDGKRVRRTAGRPARRARPAYRRTGVVDSGRALAERLHDHRRASLLQRDGHRWVLRRRERHAGPRESVRRQGRPSDLDVLHYSRPR